MSCHVLFFQAEDGIRDLVRSRGLGDVYKRQLLEKEGPGIYTYPGHFADEFFALQQRFTKGIFSLSLIHI